MFIARVRKGLSDAFSTFPFLRRFNLRRTFLAVETNPLSGSFIVLSSLRIFDEEEML